MDFIAVLVAAVASFAFGALWYGINAKAWMKAANVPAGPNGRPANGSSPAPYILSAVCAILVAGMMRHIFANSGVTELGKGLLSGLGLGAFIAAPWIATNYAYSMRPRSLTLIDTGYAIIGCGIMGAVLGLFLTPA